MARSRKTWTGIIVLAVTLLIFCSAPVKQLASLPEEIRLFEGNLKMLKISMPVTGNYMTSNPEVLQVNGNKAKMGKIDLHKPVTLFSNQVGQSELQLKWGIIPLKSVKVDVLSNIKVYPGGESIGVKLHSQGILVVGHHLVDTGTEKISPGKAADIRVGDIILSINGKKMETINMVSEMVNDAGKSNKPLNVTILRGKEKKQITLKPVRDAAEGEYRMGLYIRDEVAGVGTLTFYDPVSKKYGALGHVISDVDTEKPIKVKDGYIVRANVSSVEKGSDGTPGEKFATFEHEKLGTVTANTPFGIFGKMQKNWLEKNKKPIPIALSEEVNEGPAQILTVIEGQKVEQFDIEIVNVIKQRYPATKGMIIKVTDPALLKKTGGIIQGMSGSPIIQNGKLVGAVTHVFVNDPTSGYGSFVEWMLRDAGVELQRETTWVQKAG